MPAQTTIAKVVQHWDDIGPWGPPTPPPFPPTLISFGAPGMFTIPFPAGATRLQLIGCSAGGGGGSGRRGAAGTYRGGGGGGAGGGLAFADYAIADLIDPLQIIVGAGGAGAPSIVVDDTDGNPGLAGDDSSVIDDNGGGGGRVLLNLPGEAPGVGGSTAPAAGGVSNVMLNLPGTDGGAGTDGPGGNSANSRAGSGGGGGGGMSAADVSSIGGAGFFANQATNAGVPIGLAGQIDLPGGNGHEQVPPYPGTGGGGGGSDAPDNPGPGGNGGRGAGGGGGGGGLNLKPSGAGGHGGDAYVRLIFT